MGIFACQFLIGTQTSCLHSICKNLHTEPGVETLNPDQIKILSKLWFHERHRRHYYSFMGTTYCSWTDSISCFLLCWLLVVVNNVGTLFFFFKQKSNQQKNDLFLLDDFISMLRGCFLNKKLKLLYFLWICNLKYLKIIYCEVKR